MAALIVIIILGLVFYGGFRYGSHHTRRVNETLHTQLLLQEKFSKTWAAEATDKYNLSNQVNAQNTNNVGTTIQMVLQLLNNLQSQNTGTLNEQQNEKVSDLIARAKSIGKLHD